MASFSEIARGGAYGALFSVGGFLLPEFGVALAAYGIFTSTISAAGLWADSNVSWDRKLLATGLVIASIYGGKKAMEYTNVVRGYVPGNLNGASLIPESYMNKVGAVDMRNCTNPKGFNEAGFPRDNNWFYRQLLNKNPEWFSAENQARIQARRAPIVDDTWASYFPEQAAYKNSILVHHHVLQGPTAVPMPQPVHQACRD